MRKVLTLLAAVAVIGCPKAPEAPATRVELRRTGGSTFELIPAAGQEEHCLVFTVARDGLTRQLTMSRKNLSYTCPAGQPIGRHSYRVPIGEGPVKVYVLFTSQPINAGSVAQQILEASDRQKLHVMQMRLPGTAQLEQLEFVPEEDVAPEVGALVQADGGTAPADGGAAPTPDVGAPGTPDAADAGR